MQKQNKFQTMNLTKNWLQSPAWTVGWCSMWYTYKPWTFMVQFS